MKNGFKILLVDDEPDILEFLSYNLVKEGYTVYTAGNGHQAIEIAKKEIPNLVILDVMMPGMDGMQTCREIREHKELSGTMVAFLTARNEDYSQIAGFEVGADDYINKPIKPKVLTSRIAALMRRNVRNETATQSITIGGLEIDRTKYRVMKDGVEMVFPKKEFELLALLASMPGKVFTRNNILETIWGSDVVVGDRTIDVHIRKLREKLGDNFIKTVKGIGYKFDF